MTAAIETVPLPLVAYVVNTGIAMPLVCATRARTWMEETTERFANRCLPLLMANQAGWFLLSAHTVRVTWLGTNELSGVRVELLKGAPPHPVLSHFGHGVVTFNVPYLFRTPPGYNLLVRGPANWPKDGATPLEGLVESDWSAATFTLNWRLTRPHHPVTFEQGEPIGMLVPQRRSELEMFQPEMRMIDSAPEIRDRYQSWSRSRADFNAALAVPGSGAAKQRWQKDYFRGSVGNGATSDQHQTKLTLREFANHGVPLPPPVPVDRGPRRTPVGRVPASRSADELLEDLIVEESFLGPQVCQALVETHKKFGRLGPTSDNGYPLARTRHDNPAQFEIVRSLIRRLSGLIAERYHDKVCCARSSRVFVTLFTPTTRGSRVPGMATTQKRWCGPTVNARTSRFGRITPRGAATARSFISANSTGAATSCSARGPTSTAVSSGSRFRCAAGCWS
jgi:hypothetical protein